MRLTTRSYARSRDVDELSVGEFPEGALHRYLVITVTAVYNARLLHIAKDVRVKVELSPYLALI